MESIGSYACRARHQLWQSSQDIDRSAVVYGSWDIRLPRLPIESVRISVPARDLCDKRQRVLDVKGSQSFLSGLSLEMDILSKSSALHLVGFTGRWFESFQEQDLFRFEERSSSRAAEAAPAGT